MSSGNEDDVQGMSSGNEDDVQRIGSLLVKGLTKSKFQDFHTKMLYILFSSLP